MALAVVHDLREARAWPGLTSSPRSRPTRWPGWSWRGPPQVRMATGSRLTGGGAGADTRGYRLALAGGGHVRAAAARLKADPTDVAESRAA